MIRIDFVIETSHYTVLGSIYFLQVEYLNRRHMKTAVTRSFKGAINQGTMQKNGEKSPNGTQRQTTMSVCLSSLIALPLANPKATTRYPGFVQTQFFDAASKFKRWGQWLAGKRRPSSPCHESFGAINTWRNMAQAVAIALGFKLHGHISRLNQRHRSSLACETDT